MKNYFLPLLFLAMLFSSISGMAQETAWDFNKIPPRGFFNTFNDLKYSHPQTLEFTAVRPRYGIHAPYEGFDDLFIIKDKNGRQMQNIYAFSNGYELYVRGAFVGGYKGYFAPAKTRGRYLFFEYADEVGGGDLMGVNGGSMVVPKSVKVRYFVLDTETGESMNFRKNKTTKRMFSDYPELLAEVSSLKKIDQGYRSVKRLQINKTYCRLVQQLNDRINATK